MTRRQRKQAERETVRCAIYTRKSTDEGLDSDFSTLDAQREAAESYIKSQRSAGWECVLDRFDDGGYSGASMDRPALKRLLAQVEAGKIDAVVVYRFDRLTRAIADFARITEVLEAHQCALVSVSEQINTATPSGRLHLHMLASFAQHEREVIAERTRDKMSAARRKGRWTGGTPVLGYHIDEKRGGRLLVEKQEAKVVREAFELYVEHQALSTTAAALNARRRTTKRYLSKRGGVIGGKPWTKTNLVYLLRNPIYTGKVVFEGETYDGEHDAIIDDATFERVQGLLRRNGRAGGRATRNKYGALLRGILRCGPCEASMIHSTTQRGQRLHRYYTCQKAQQNGWNTCPSKSLPAAEIEKAVVERIRSIGADPEVRREVLANLDPRTTAEERAVIEALERFTPLWEAMSPREQVRAMQLLVECVVYDGERETIAITFRPNGTDALNQKGAA